MRLICNNRLPREKVYCTSKLNGWIVPRKITVKPKPLGDIKVKKVQFGKHNPAKPTVITYDPRAPQDTTLNTYALYKLYDNLQEHTPNSALFSYHDPATCDEETHFFMILIVNMLHLIPLLMPQHVQSEQ